MKNKIFTVLVIYLSAFMLICPEKSIGAVNSSITLCGKVVIPSLFPFIFCGNLLISLGFPRVVSRILSPYTYKLFGVSGGGTVALILGMLCGYPMGAVCVKSLYDKGELSKNEAERLLSYSNNAGPVFIISVVGVSLLSNYKTGLLLYFIHITVSLLFGLILRFFIKENSSRDLYPSRDEKCDFILDLGNSITESVETIFKICGFIIIFSVITSAIPDNILKPYITAFLEISAGIKELCVNQNSFTLPLISAFLSFSGISVLAQVSAVAKSLSLKYYIWGKLIQSIISFSLTYVLTRLFPNALPVYSPEITMLYHIPTEKELIYSSLITVIFGLIVVLILAIIGKIADKHED